MRIELDQDKCIAAGQCVFAAPDVFDQRDDDGVAFLVEDHPTAEHERSANEAAALCPAAAIHVHAQ